MQKFAQLLKFKRSTKGVAAIEFAILLPFLIFVFFGVYQISAYIIAIRKIDNITNDIGYLISREGCIANDNVNNTPSSCLTNIGGGRNELESLFNNTIPFLIFPYKYNPFDGSSQIKVKYVGLPLLSSVCSAKVNSNTMRILWEEIYPLNPVGTGVARVTTDNQAVGLVAQCNSPNNICPKACDGNNYWSNYTEGNKSRANMVYPGQSFILVNIAFDFKALLGNNFLGFMLPHNVEKLASYATRGTVQLDVNNNPQVQNNLHYCTDCNVYNSSYPAGGTGAAMTQDSAGGVSIYRQICDESLYGTTNYNASGGCKFY